MRVERIGDSTLYLCDAREALAEITGAHLLVSDPPYRLTSGGNSARNISKDFRPMGGFFRPGSEYANSGEPVVVNCEFSDWLPAAFAALADDADAYVMSNDKNMRALLNALDDAGFGLHNILVWDKVSATPNRWYMKNVEFVAYAWKGKAKTIRAAKSKQLIRCPQRDETQHPTEKPVALMEHYIINSTEQGDTVLDPFMGSGTTGVAAIRAGRKFIGVEITEEWFDVACERIEAAQHMPAIARASSRPENGELSDNEHGPLFAAAGEGEG